MWIPVDIKMNNNRIEQVGIKWFAEQIDIKSWQCKYAYRFDVDDTKYVEYQDYLLLQNTEIWDFVDLTKLAKKQFTNKVILLEERKDYYVIMQLVQNEKALDKQEITCVPKYIGNSFSDKIWLLNFKNRFKPINADIQVQDNEMIMTGKYTDFHENYIKLSTKNIEKYDELRQKFEVFSSDIKLDLDYNNRIVSHLLSNTINNLRIPDGVQFLDVGHVSEFRRYNIEKLTIPSTFQGDILYVLIHIRGLKELKFEDGYTITEEYDTKNMHPNSTNSMDLQECLRGVREIYFPKSIEYISQHILSRLSNATVYMYEESYYNLCLDKRKGTNYRVVFLD